MVNDNDVMTVFFPLPGIVAEKQGCHCGHQHLRAARGRALSHKHQVLHPQTDRLGLDQVSELHQGPLHCDHANHREFKTHKYLYLYSKGSLRRILWSLGSLLGPQISRGGLASALFLGRCKKHTVQANFKVYSLHLNFNK